MRTTQNLTRAPWRKSSYSSDQSDCVECAPIGGAQWRKSSHSTGEGSDCVEVAPLPHAIAIRDSKRPAGPALLFPADVFAAFIRAQA